MTDDEIRYHFDSTWINLTLTQVAAITGRTVAELKRLLGPPTGGHGDIYDDSHGDHDPNYDW